MTNNANENNKSNLRQKIKKVWEFLKHPVTALVVGIVATIFFYNLGLKDIKPRYSVSEPELIAEQTLDAPDLKLFWKDDEVKDISSVKIAIWNSGKQYLDNTAISDTDPIRILIPKGVNVLYSEFVTTSRKELQFKTSKEALNGNYQYILIEIDGDEALEYNDGGIIKILYTGQPTTTFVVQGRIKGSKEGFARTAWKEINIPLFIAFIINAIITPFSIFSIARQAFERLSNNRWKNRVFVFEAAMTLILSGALIFILIFLFNSFISAPQPNWIK